MKIFEETPFCWCMTLDGLIFTGFSEYGSGGYEFVAITSDECDYNKSGDKGLPYRGKKGRFEDFFL